VPRCARPEREPRDDPELLDEFRCGGCDSHMTEKFIDDLYEELDADRRQKLGIGATAKKRLQEPPDALSPWWEAFVVRLGQLVGAWNEKDQSAPPITFTRTHMRELVLSHPRAHAEFRIEDDRITRTMQCDGAAATATVIDLHLDERGSITAVVEGKPVSSPASAADEVIRPLLIDAFDA